MNYGHWWNGNLLSKILHCCPLCLYVTENSRQCREGEGVVFQEYAHDKHAHARAHIRIKKTGRLQLMRISLPPHCLKSCDLCSSEGGERRRWGQTGVTHASLRERPFLVASGLLVLSERREHRMGFQMEGGYKSTLGRATDGLPRSKMWNQPSCFEWNKGSAFRGFNTCLCCFNVFQTIYLKLTSHYFHML